MNGIYIAVNGIKNQHLSDVPCDASLEVSEILKISRLLRPEDQVDLLIWVNLAYAAENSIRKSLGLKSR